MYLMTITREQIWNLFDFAVLRNKKIIRYSIFVFALFFKIMIRCKIRFVVFGPFSKIAIMMKRYFVDLSQYTHYFFSSYESRSSWWVVVFLESVGSECVRRHVRDETFVYSHPDTRGDEERDAVIDRMTNTDDVFWDWWRRRTKRNPTGPEIRSAFPGDIDIFSRYEYYFPTNVSIIFQNLQCYDNNGYWYFSWIWTMILFTRDKKKN